MLACWRKLTGPRREGAVKGIGCTIVSLGAANWISLTTGGHIHAKQTSRCIRRILQRNSRFSHHNNSLVCGNLRDGVVQLLLHFGLRRRGIPAGGLVFDSKGNLYGTTNAGGTGQGCADQGTGCGTVFELIPNNGKWTEKVLYNFCPVNGMCPDGYSPSGSLILDRDGNLYGTTTSGGTVSGGGTVFELTHKNGKWTEKVLYSFGYSPDGSDPEAGLVFDKYGNLYGTTFFGGTKDSGTVFELMRGNGKWTEKILYNFAGYKNGGNPRFPVILDKAGNLYGTIVEGGAYGDGLVFELVLDKGRWTQKWLHSFNHDGKDGIGPGPVIVDNVGNLYGTTANGGADTSGCNGYGCGTVFELMHNNSKWTEKVLHSFDGKDGHGSETNVIFDNVGNLYGTTYEGGTDSSGCNGFGCGTVFELTPNNGKWTEKLLHSFGSTPDGAQPSGNLIRDAAGNVYGTTEAGGANSSFCFSNGGCGTVFEVTP
jgi:uncharacterized repeat protein (TIGR03803 family)